MNWYQISYISEDSFLKMRLINAVDSYEAIQKCKRYAPKATGFVSKQISTGTRTK